MRERVGVLQMPMGNLRSVLNAVDAAGCDAVRVDDARGFDDLTHLIIPGVGHFKAVMGHLVEQELVRPVRDFAASGRPLLGICVGMQLLADAGVEGGETAGLGLVSGLIEQLPADPRFGLPHVGWSEVEQVQDHPVFDGVKPDRDFYFVHSFGLLHGAKSEMLGRSTYGQPFSSVVGRDNVVGFQFHPEKSQANGLRMVENFCYWDGAL